MKVSKETKTVQVTEICFEKKTNLFKIYTKVNRIENMINMNLEKNLVIKMSLI